MRACWAVTHEEAFLPLLGFLRTYLVCFGCLVPGMYEVIQYTLSLSSNERSHALAFFSVLGLALDLSLVSSASVDADGSAPRPRPGALKHRHGEKMRNHGLWCSRQLWAFAPLVVSTAGVPHAGSLRFLELLATQTVQAIVAQRAGVDVDGAGAVWGRAPRKCGVRSSGTSRRSSPSSR
jgi:hypothetical protein